MRLLIGSLLFNFLLIPAWCAEPEYELELLQVMFRHGERYSIKEDRDLVGSDSYDATFKNFTDWGLLTQTGKVNLYDLGKLLRSRYNYFLGGYRSDEVYARSTNVDRTKMSLLLTLAGLYPPTSATRWSSKIDWIPIPIYSEPLASDSLLVNFYGPCLKYGKMLEEAEAAPEITAKMNKYLDFYAELKKKIQISEFTPSRIFFIYSYVRTIVALNWPLPTWCSKKDYQKLEEISGIFMEALTYGVPMRKAVVGALIEEIAEKLKDDGESAGKKLYLYGTHDTILGSYLRAHNITGIPSLADYGSAVMIEKLRDVSTNNIYVRMFYWTGVSKKIIPITMPNCGRECPLQKYTEIIAPIVPNEEEKQCYFTKTASKK